MHEYPNLTLLPVRESRDDWRRLEDMTAQPLGEHPDLIGLYNAGGGTRGIVSGLEAAGRAKAENVPLIESQERIRIDIFLRDNLP